MDGREGEKKYNQVQELVFQIVYLIRFEVDYLVIKSKEMKFSWHGENLRPIKLSSHTTKVRNTKENTELRYDIQMFILFSTWIFNCISVSKRLPLLFLSWGSPLFHYFLRDNYPTIRYKMEVPWITCLGHLTKQIQKGHSFKFSHRII